MKHRWFKFWLVLFSVIISGCATTAEREAERARIQRAVDTNAQLGATYLGRGQLAFAEEKLKKALALDSADSQANNIMALLQWRLKDYDGAERFFRKALDTEKANPAAQNNYGTFLCDRGKVDDAVAWFEKAASNPMYNKSGIAYENAGMCLMKKPVPRTAERYFRQALKYNSKLPGSLYQMAQISFDTGKTLAARGFIQRFFEVAKDAPESLLLAVKIEHALHNRNEEASYALRLKSKFPDSPEAKFLRKGRLGKSTR